MIGKMRMHFRQGMSVREIAQVTSLSRYTARKYLRPAEVVEPTPTTTPPTHGTCAGRSTSVPPHPET